MLLNPHEKEKGSAMCACEFYRASLKTLHNDFLFQIERSWKEGKNQKETNKKHREAKKNISVDIFKRHKNHGILPTERFFSPRR